MTAQTKPTEENKSEHVNGNGEKVVSLKSLLANRVQTPGVSLKPNIFEFVKGEIKDEDLREEPHSIFDL